LRYDFIVHPGADPSQIKFELEGEFNEYLKNEALCYTISFGEVQIQDLYAYQHSDKKQVQAKFTQQNSAWQFQLGGYDKTQPLVIDPLIYSTYIGGNDSETANGIAIDGSGNAYITGGTWSTDYDITPGAFQTVKGAITDVFVTKLNSTGTGLIYSTFIGGGDTDYGYAIAIDGFGNAYITGSTVSTDYDITPGAFQTTGGGFYPDVFVTKLNSTGTGLIYSTYIGGNNYDYGTSIAIDNSGNAYITGATYSTDYPITPGAFQTTKGVGDDVFVTKLNSTGTGLIYSTYIGGSDYDFGYAIALDGSGNAYITGETWSTDYDITPGAFQTTLSGSEGWPDVFVTKLNSTGTGLIYSTYIGGSDYDYGFAIAIDNSGNAYVTGVTNSTDYNITAGAFQTTIAGFSDVFVTQLNSTGTGLIYSTYIGGSNEDGGYSIAIDDSGNAYITGFTTSTDYDITPGTFQTTGGGSNTDVFVTKLNSTGTGLIYSTYIGGSSNDVGYSIAIDGSGNAYITGETYSTDYDTTPGAFQATNVGIYDVFVTKLNSTGSGLIYSTYIGGSDEDRGNSIAIDHTGNAYVTGETYSTDYDITPDVFQNIYGGSQDVFVTKLNSTGTALLYSTYIGGSDYDYALSIALDKSGNVYITGWTESTDYDITRGAFQTNCGGGTTDLVEVGYGGDAFITKLNSTGTALIYSTYIGGTREDRAHSIAIDSSGNAYITGNTKSTDYDITPGAFQTTNGGGTYEGDVFVTKIDLSGTSQKRLKSKK
jgi:hypothetical protein